MRSTSDLRRMCKRDVGVVFGAKVGLNRCRDGAAACVPQNDDELQAVSEMTHCEIDAAEAFRSQHVSGDANDEQVVERLIKDRLDGNSGVGTAQHDGIGLLRGNGAGPQGKSQRYGTKRQDDGFFGFLAERGPLRPSHHRCQTAVPIAKDLHGRGGIRHGFGCDGQVRVVTVD